MKEVLNNKIDSDVEEGEIQVIQMKTITKKSCKVCKKNKRNYTCPSCEIGYCSLNCYNRHVKTTECEGKLNYAKKLRKAEMNLTSIKRDFRYLSEKITTSNTVFKKLNLVEKGGGSQSELMRFKILRTHCKERNISLLFSPPIFDRHRKNISFYYMKEKEIYWNIEISLLSIDERTKLVKRIDIFYDPVSENTHITDLFEDFPFQNDKVVDYFGAVIDKDSLIDKLSKDDMLMYLRNECKAEEENDNAEEGEINVDIKEKTKQESYELISFDRDSTVKDITSNQAILEFPTIYLIKKGDSIFLQKSKLYKEESFNITIE